MMVNNRLSASCFEIGAAPRAYEEDCSYIDDFDDITDDVSTAEISSAISQRSSIVTADSGRASSSSTYKSPEKDGNKKKSKKMVVCRVALLDGTTFEPKGIDKNSDGQVVFEKVTKHLDIIETDYFGLTYRDKSGKKFWLDNTKKISKQVKGGTWVFEFQVKFYPPDPMSLKEDVTRYQLCLQVRVDLFNGRLPCSFATYALLGSYTVQAELGDWEHKDYGDTTAYLNEFDFAPGQNAELLDKIAELHRNQKGQAPSMAEAHFLENSKKLAMYGVDMHDVKDFENKRLTLGICANGILVYKDRLRVSRFVWPKILKLSYKRDAFYVKIRPGEFEPHERTISFRCDSHKLAKRLWKTCVEHHAFFRLKTADPPNSDTLFPRFNTRFRYSGRTAAQARKAAEMTDREEPHIARTAERRSIHDKAKSGGNISAKPYDENDVHDHKAGDPDATLERDSHAAGLYGQNQKAPNGEDAADRLDNRPGGEPGTEGPPGYSADVSALSDGGKKSKKEKEEEKKRKKEEEKRRKEEEKERKRLEKEQKKKGKGAQETAIDDVGDAALMEQKEKDKKASSGGGLFGLLRRSQRDKSEKGAKDKTEAEKKADEQIEQEVEPVHEPDLEHKPKPVPTWALPGMQEMMEKRSAANQASSEDKSSDLPRIEVEEAAEDIDPDTQEYETDCVPAKSENQAGVVVVSENQSDVTEKSENHIEVVAEAENQSDETVNQSNDVEKSENQTDIEVESTKVSESETNQPEAKSIIIIPEIVDRSESAPGEVNEGLIELEVDRPVESERRDLIELEIRVEGDKADKADAALGTDVDVGLVSAVKEEEEANRTALTEPQEVLEIKPKPVPTWALPGMQEMMEKRAVANQLKEDYTQLLRETPDITSTTRLEDVEYKLQNDPRYMTVDPDARQRWFNEYVDDMLKADFMRLLRDTPSIDSQSTWPEARQEIDRDPRFTAVDSEAQRNRRFDGVDSETQREQWFNEYIQGLLKSEFMQLLRDTPMVTSDARLDDVKVYIEHDPRYQAVPNDRQREEWFNEYVDNLKKDEFIQLLNDTPSITSYCKYPEVREDICNDPRFANVATEEQRQQYFNEHTQNLKKAAYVQLLQDTPDITGHSQWHQSKHLIDTDPRYHAVDSDLLRAKWFNEHVNNLAGLGYGDVDYGLKIGGYKSIDRKLEFLPISPPSSTTKKTHEEPMPFFDPPGETDVDSLGRKKAPPPIAKKPRGSMGFESEEDRLLNSQTGVPVTVRTESYKYSPDMNDVPRPTSNIPIVETKTHKYKTERDGVIETRVERKITVTSDDNDEFDHDALLRAAIEEVTNMNPDLSVEKIECMRQIEEVNGN